MEKQENRLSDEKRASSKKPYQKPEITWEEKIEPVTHAVTCAVDPLGGPQCGSSVYE